MKRVVLVAYDFANGSEKYEPLIAELQTFGPWMHFIKNSWLIETDEPCQAIFDRLKPFLDNEINLLVVEVGRDRQGWLPENAWEWIRERLPARDYA